MLNRTVTRSISLATSMLAVLVLAGCGHSLSGTYSGKDTGFLDKLTFKSGGKVELTFMGMTKEGTYEIEGDKVKITNAGDTTILTIGKDGCLEGGGIIGRYCKEGGGSVASNGSELSGIYEASNEGGSIRLEFRPGSKVRVSFSERGGASESSDGSYELRGDQLTVTAPGGDQLLLTHKGDVLEQDLGDGTIRFKKR